MLDLRNDFWTFSLATLAWTRGNQTATNCSSTAKLPGIFSLPPPPYLPPLFPFSFLSFLSFLSFPSFPLVSRFWFFFFFLFCFVLFCFVLFCFNFSFI